MDIIQAYWMPVIIAALIVYQLYHVNKNKDISVGFLSRDNLKKVRNLGSLNTKGVEGVKSVIELNLMGNNTHGDNFVGIKLATSRILDFGQKPYVLTITQANELSELLSSATERCNNSNLPKVS